MKGSLRRGVLATLAIGEIVGWILRTIAAVLVIKLILEGKIG